MKLLHSMIRVKDLELSLHFYCDLLGLKETSRKDFPQGQFTLVFLSAAGGGSEIELTHNWDNTESYSKGRNFGHLALEVEDIYQTCTLLMENGVDILRPPRDGHMAFVCCPDQISIELLQEGPSKQPIAPWDTMENKGSW